ncbi:MULTISPECIES: FadR/GntR family transcriptional regulator [Rothia]|uniref:FadR/GntR family transcriptional regulator n=1 Tax=Rothia TaxID=32207 RepID=UPI001F435CC8|nr:FadR/GntR family transcriptional regulator [Rothia nasimurium]
MSRVKAERVVEEFLSDVERGRYTVGQSMPSEAELAEHYGVSRLTVREAVKYLAARGVLDVAHGRRNQLAPAETWSILDPDIAITRGKLTGDSLAWTLKLMEARTIVEVGAVALAARRISDNDLKQMNDLLAVMDSQDVEAVVAADMAFHRLIFDAAANEYITATYDSLEAILRSIRRKTSSSAAVRQEAQHWHRAIYQALATHDEKAARDAMESHMLQTAEGIKKTLTN